MKSRFAAFAASLLLSGVMIPSAMFAQNELNHGSSSDKHPDGRGNRNRETPAPNPKGESGGAVVTGNGISYHGGPVMQGVVNVYYIWYGDWTKDPGANQILTDWGNHIGGSPYENINTTYGDTTGNVSGAVTLAGSVNMPSSTFGTALSDSNIASIVSSAFSSGLTADTNAVYFVLTAPGITETSGFLSKYCGWHTWATIGGKNIKYSFVGNAQGPNLGSCAWQTTQSPNGDPGADAMVSVMAHELEEAISDPNLNAWYDTTGAENADKCAWTFGATHPASGGGIANMVLGNRDFLIQQNWLNAGGGSCALSYTSAGPNFSISANPASSLSITQGASANSTVTVTSLNGFSSAVGLTVSGCPANATCAPSVTPVTPASGGTATSTLTITTNTSTTTGPFTVTVTGTSGTLLHTATVSGTVNAPPVPNFSISASPSSLTLAQNASGSSTVTVNSLNGFSSAVDLGVTGCPLNASCTLSPTSVTPPSGSSAASTLTVLTGSAAAGTYTLTIAGSSGSLNHSTTVTLQVNGPVPDFTISAAPSSQIVSRGSSTSYTVTIAPVNGFTGAVSFSVSGLPSRVSTSFSPNPVTGSGTSTMTVTANRNGRTGTSTLTIKGTSGSLSHSTTVSLTVN